MNEALKYLERNYPSVQQQTSQNANALPHLVPTSMSRKETGKVNVVSMLDSSSGDKK